MDEKSRHQELVDGLKLAYHIAAAVLDPDRTDDDRASALTLTIIGGFISACPREALTSMDGMEIGRLLREAATERYGRPPHGEPQHQDWSCHAGAAAEVAEPGSLTL